MSDFEELTITLPDGYGAWARYWPGRGSVGAVLYLHGIQSHGGWYEHSARCLQEAGFAVLQPDRRGSGRNRRDRGHAQSARQLIDDGLVCGEQLLARAGARQFHLVGISWGGRLACAMMLARRETVKSLTLVCPGLFPQVDVTAVERLKIGVSMLGNRKRLFDIPLNDPGLFTSQPKWIEFLRNDPLTIHQATAAFYLATRRMDGVVKNLPRCRPAPVHLVVSEDDSVIDSQKTIDYIRSLNWPATTVTAYPSMRHTLEFEPVREAYFQALVGWLLSVS